MQPEDWILFLSDTQSQTRERRLHQRLPSLHGSTLGQISCPFCKDVLQDMSLFRTHMSHYHKNQMPYSCSLCGRGYLSASGLARHMQSHRGKTFMCPICDSKFTQKFTVKPHLRSVHGLDQCSNCLLLFKLGYEYRSHIELCGNPVM